MMIIRNGDKTFLKEYERLNKAQKLAVDTIEGPVMVVAGPGTGKTQVLAMRIGNILQKTQINPHNILALTFTESAASNMKQRLIHLIGHAGYYVNISTFHSFCNSIIQEFPGRFAFSRKCAMLDDLSRIKVIQEVIDETKLEMLTTFYDKYYYQKAIINCIRKLKQENVTYRSFENVLEKQEEALEQSEKKVNPKTGKPYKEFEIAQKALAKNRELLEIYRSYNAKLVKHGFYDFEDMILFVIEKLKTDSELRAILQERYQYILVDEYQDTNGAQNTVLKLLGSFDRKPNIFVVGDDDQSIYRFQGAALENVLSFHEQFEDVHTVVLTNNYRSTQNIINASSSVIENNTERLTETLANVSKELRAVPVREGANIQSIECTTSHEEHCYIVETIESLQKEGVALKDIAVLYRRHRDASNLIDLFAKHEIPFQVAARQNVLENIRIQQLLALLKLIENPKDNHLLFRVLLFDFLNISRLNAYSISKRNHGDRHHAFDLLDNMEELKKRNIQDLEAFKTLKKNVLEWRASQQNLSFIQFVEKVMHESGFVESIVHSRDIDELNQMKTFFEFIRNANLINPKLSIRHLFEDITLMEEYNITIEEDPLILDRDAVTLMTVHKAKGTEFPHVFFMGLYDKNWGGYKPRELIKLPQGILSLERQANPEEEERRLFYVALTRAREVLHLSFSKYNSDSSGVISGAEAVPSRYLLEINDKFMNQQEKKEGVEEHLGNLQSLFMKTPEKDYTEEEKHFLKALINDMKLSVTGLNNYLECPRKFQYQNLLRIPRTIEGEKERDKTLYLGRSIHYALEQFFREIQHGKIPNEKFLFQQFEESLKTELIGGKAFEDTLEEGRKVIEAYFGYYDGTFIAPAELEYTFSNVYLDDIPLTGKADKVEFIDKGRKTAKIIDYKVSKPHSRNDILGKTERSNGSEFRQLVFYKLLSERDKKFSYKYADVVTCELEYIKPNSRGVFKKELFEIKKQDIDTLTDQIKSCTNRIRNLQFPKTLDRNVCKRCAYERICSIFQSLNDT
jgi:DNA helicase-2/ATP-dependent DNA helicase PcrA